MPAEERNPYHHYEEDVAEEHSSFDELAAGLASGTLTRARAMKLIGAALVGGLLRDPFKTLMIGN